MATPSPRILVEAGAGGQKVRIRYVSGDEAAAFDLARRALPALQELARATRGGPEAGRSEQRGL
jgi:hypothetical protein